MKKEVQEEKDNSFGIYKIGDIVRLKEKDGWWKNTSFEITAFHGNRYCPMCLTNIVGKFYSNGKPQQCNLDTRDITLLGSKKRPLRRIKKVLLIKLLQKNNVEAKREFLIRSNINQL